MTLLPSNQDKVVPMMILAPSRTVLEALFAVMAGDFSPKESAAGAPVIRAATVPSVKPKRP
jgi:hypothetical protein